MSQHYRKAQRIIRYRRKGWVILWVVRKPHTYAGFQILYWRKNEK